MPYHIKHLMLILFFIMYSRRKKPRSSSKYSRNVFDPQYMYQHGLTRRQAKGVVLQPKAQNLDNPDVRIDESILQRYAKTLFQYRRLGSIRVFNLSVNLQTEVMPQALTLNSSIILQFLESQGITSDRIISAFIPSFRLTKENQETFPSAGYFTYNYFSWHPQSSIGDTDLVTAETNDLSVSSSFLTASDNDTFQMQYPKFYTNSNNRQSGYAINVRPGVISKSNHPLLWEYISQHTTIPFVTYNFDNIPNDACYLTFELGFDDVSVTRKLNFDVYAYLVN